MFAEVETGRNRTCNTLAASDNGMLDVVSVLSPPLVLACLCNRCCLNKVVLFNRDSFEVGTVAVQLNNREGGGVGVHHVDDVDATTSVRAVCRSDILFRTQSEKSRGRN